ncbi:MAG: type IV secretory system conjugative DNA transfer family protein [Myxococcota bacterium]
MYEKNQHPPDIILGQTDFRGEHRPFGMYTPDRLRHVWVIGENGAGKSTLLLNLIAQDLAAGRGVGVLDPHGDLARAVLHLVPKSRTNDVAYVDPADKTHAVSFNVLRQGGAGVEDSLTASGLIAVFKKHWADVWGPRLEHVLRNAILAVVPDSRASLLFMYRFLTDERLRAKMAPRIEDPVVRQFWTVEFPGYRAALQAEALSPVLNKLGAFVTNPFVRRIVAQEKSRLDLGALIEARGVLIANLSVGDVGEDASHLLGSLLVSAVQVAAMRREAGEPPFFLYIDEFQHFVTESLATMLSEARKFGVGLTLSHQYLAQLPPRLLDAVRGNVGSLVVMRLGADDAVLLEREVNPPFGARDLVALPFGRAVAKLTVRGSALSPFSARMLPPVQMPSDDAARVDAIIQQSRRRFTTPVSVIDRFVGDTFTAPDTSV